jgi:hypothetical protein
MGENGGEKTGWMTETDEGDAEWGETFAEVVD